MNNKNFILACESSCDETAWCIYEPSTKTILAHTLHSQIKNHQKFGGVVPEIASQEHLDRIDALLNHALSDAQIPLSSISYFAATTHPGLPGSLLIGSSYTKALAWSMQKPFLGINHLAGHIYSVLLENEIKYPCLCLSASGGHSALYIVYDNKNYTCIGNTRDDAAGELFDKIAKLMNLGYPGGPLIEQAAQHAGFSDTRSYPRLKYPGCDLSFSGLKTAVLYDLVNLGFYSLEKRSLIKEIPLSVLQEVASSLLHAVTDIFLNRINNAYEQHPMIKSVSFVGGVACNRYIKEKIKQYAQKKNLAFFSPPKKFCTDNAAMIACVAAQQLSDAWSYTTDIRH